MKRVFKSLFWLFLMTVALLPVNTFAAEISSSGDSVTIKMDVNIQYSKESPQQLKDFSGKVSIKPINGSPMDGLNPDPVAFRGVGTVKLGELKFDKSQVGDYYYEVSQTLEGDHKDLKSVTNPLIVRVCIFLENGDVRGVMWAYPSQEIAESDKGQEPPIKEKTDLTFNMYYDPEIPESTPSKPSTSKPTNTAAQIDNGAGYIVLLAGSLMLILLIAKQSKEAKN